MLHVLLQFQQAQVLPKTITNDMSSRNPRQVPARFPLDVPRTRAEFMNFLWQLPGCLWMTPACPPVFLLDPDIFVFCMLHLVCLCFKMKVEISWCVGCDGSFVEVSIGNSLNSTATLNRSYKREHSRTRLRLINTGMATVKLHLSKPDTWNHEIYISWQILKSWMCIMCIYYCVYRYVYIYTHTNIHMRQIG